MKNVICTALVAMSLMGCGDRKGLPGPTGPSGTPGPSGPTGAQGSTGATGAPGKSVTTVKLCQDDTSAYPEYGVIIGDNLYGVYYGSTPTSATPQAFLALLIPGDYLSTGGNGCSFTVNQNGTIKEN